MSFKYVYADQMMMDVNKDIAVSSGSACTSASMEPSYVLKALGMNDDLVHSSLRFALGRFTTEQEIEYAIQRISRSVNVLREKSIPWEMYLNEKMLP